MASNYTVPPPSYAGPKSKQSSATPDQEAAQPLLGPAAGSSSGFGSYYDQPEAGDVPDDFKVTLGLSDRREGCSWEI